MAESFFAQREADRREVLEVARERTGRPTHLLEKDAWVVWVLAAVFESPAADHLTFKGGTSLSKAYRMVADEVMIGGALAFTDLMLACEALQDRANRAAA